MSPFPSSQRTIRSPRRSTSESAKACPHSSTPIARGSWSAQDGLASFTRVFEQESRTVVVLYRPGWGDRGWTNVEQTAIQNRRLDQGCDFVTAVSVTDPPEGPVWYPEDSTSDGVRALRTRRNCRPLEPT